MSTGTQADLDWAGVDAAPGAAQAPSMPSPGSAIEAKYLTDEEILEIDPPSPAEAAGYGGPGPRKNAALDRANGVKGDSAAIASESDAETEGGATQATGVADGVAMPEWMTAAAADPRHSAEARELWREHQEFRAAFASPEEARAVKELLPGGVRDVLSLREATQSVERIDAALFSGDARAQAEVVAEIARANPAAFRSLFAEAAKVLAGFGGREAGGMAARSFDGSTSNELATSPTLRQNREGWGTRNSEVGDSRSEVGSIRPETEKDSRDDDRVSRYGDDRPERGRHSHDGKGGSVPPGLQGASDPRPGDPDTSGGSAVSGLQPRASNFQNFDPAAYTQFERATNDAVARDVRGSISDTLTRVMPEGVAEGAARRIGEDIFHEVHRALAGDKTLSEQVAAVLRERRFGGAEQQRVSALLAGRARQLVPSVARRVIGEWTSSVLSTARNKAARQAAAASRVDIATPGGSLDSTPLRSVAAGSGRQLNYASMSDEEILNS